MEKARESDALTVVMLVNNHTIGIINRLEMFKYINSRFFLLPSSGNVDMFSIKVNTFRVRMNVFERSIATEIARDTLHDAE